MDARRQNTASTPKTTALCSAMGMAPADATSSGHATCGSSRQTALFYDGNRDAEMPSGAKNHMNRDIGLTWLRLPLVPPAEER